MYTKLLEVKINQYIKKNIFNIMNIIDYKIILKNC